MIKTPKGLRLHIGVFGRRNVGKSSVLNALVRQNVSIVSDIAGTTTDPVEKVMELKPIGPVVFIDTAGVDDIGALGQARVAKTMKVIDRTELAILVTDDWKDYERQLLALFEERRIPYVVSVNKSDLRLNSQLEKAIADAGVKLTTSTNAKDGDGISQLREMIVKETPEDFLSSSPIIADLIEPGDMVAMVTPIDIEAPKGRLKMLQVHCLREILDCNSYAMIVKETELPEALSKFNVMPSLIVCDSQVFDEVAKLTPAHVKLTTFSILMARFKGDFQNMLKGAETLNRLSPGDRVLIAEACTHHPIGEDIGRIQIPRLLQQHAGGSLAIDVVAGRDFPDDLTLYKLIIHCGACMFNRREMLSRIDKAIDSGVPITNYGMAIAHLHGILQRALEPFAKTDKAARAALLPA